MATPENSLVDRYTPLSYWQLSEGSGTTAADSKGLSNGTYRNGVGLGKSGPFGGSSEAAAELDGQNDCIEIGHNQAFELANGTLQFWFNPTSTNGVQGLFSKDVKGKADHFGIWLTDGRLSVRSQSNSDALSLASSAGSVLANQWNHVAVSWGSNGLQLYLNGQWVDGNSSWKAGWAANQEAIVIGADNQFSDTQQVNKPEFFFKGKIDDVALYEGSLSATDIAQLFLGSTAQPINHAPLAQDNNYQVEKGQKLEINTIQGVLLNDSDPDGDALTATTSSTSTAKGGQIVLAKAGSFSYTPPVGFTGTDQFNYTASDGRGGSATAVVRIEVTASTSPGTSATKNSLVDRYTPLSYWQLSEGSGTTAADSKGLSNGTYRNGVGLGKSGPFGGSSEAAAELDGQNDCIEIGHNQAFELANGTLQFWFNPTSTNGVQGLFSKDVKGKADHFGIWLTDGRLSVRSQSNSDALSLASSAGSVLANQWNHVAVSWGSNGLQLYLNGQWVDGNSSWKAGWAANQEAIVIGADNQFSDTQQVNKPEFFFKGKIDDVALYEGSLSATDIAQLFLGSTAQPINHAPLAQDNNYQVEKGQKLEINTIQGVLLNDSDPDGDALTATTSSTSTAKGGQIVLAKAGSFSYTPPVGFTGTDQFNYTASDGRGGSATAVVRIEVTASTSPGTSATKNSLVDRYTPLSYWQLSEGSGTTAADSKGLSNGTYRNGVGLGKSGPFGGSSEAAAELDGQNDCIEIGHNQAFELANGTLQFWFNPTSTNGVQGLFSKDVKGKADHFGIWLTDGRLSVRSQSNSDALSLASSAGSVLANQWNHVAVSWGSNGLQLYLNGQWVDGNSSWKAGWAANQEAIVIGADNQFSDTQQVNKPEFFFKGKIDDVALYEGSLSATDIAQLFLGSTAQPNPNPNPSNNPPVVDAGDNRSITSLAWQETQLSGSVTDDSASVTTQWVQKNGPRFGVALFGDANKQKTTATFSQAGSYTLQLIANDGTHQVFDEVTITVDRPKMQLMPLGDSITHGDKTHDSSRRPLWKKLQLKGYKVDFVGSQTQNYTVEGDTIKLHPSPNSDFDLNHEGHSGWRADEILNGSYNSKRLGDNGQSNINLWAQNHSPDMVLLHLGTNDIIQDQSADSTIDDLENIIDRLQSIRPNVSILIAQIIPPANSQRRAKVKDLNALIPALAAQKNRPGSPVRIVDQWTGYDPINDNYDGLHPNANGEQKMTNRWFTGIEDLAYYGNEHFGRGKIDVLTGQVGADTFVLGNFGDPYYNDGLANSQGFEDYALIKNFQKEKDFIQLVGAASDYLTQVSPILGIAGKAIYWDVNKSGAAKAELIGIVEGVESLDLSSESFLYV